MPSDPITLEMAGWLRQNYGDDLADRFVHGSETLPPLRQRKLMHVALALHEMFPGDNHLDFDAALAFFGLPPLSKLGIGPLSQKMKAGHLIVHMASHGGISLECKEWPSNLQRPPSRAPLFPIEDEEQPLTDAPGAD